MKRTLLLLIILLVGCTVKLHQGLPLSAEEIAEMKGRETSQKSKAIREIYCNSDSCDICNVAEDYKDCYNTKDSFIIKGEIIYDQYETPMLLYYDRDGGVFGKRGEESEYYAEKGTGKAWRYFPLGKTTIYENLTKESENKEEKQYKLNLNPPPPLIIRLADLPKSDYSVKMESPEKPRNVPIVSEIPLQQHKPSDNINPCETLDPRLVIEFIMNNQAWLKQHLYIFEGESMTIKTEKRGIGVKVIQSKFVVFEPQTETTYVLTSTEQNLKELCYKSKDGFDFNDLKDKINVPKSLYIKAIMSKL